MDKKKILIPIAVVVVIAIIVSIAMFVMGKKEPQIDTSKMSEKLDPYISNMTQEEIKDVLDTETTKEQQEVFKDTIDMISIPDVDSEITVADDGTVHYTDTEGNDISIPEDNPELSEKTDEELEEEYQKMRDELQNYINQNQQSNDNSNTGSNQTGNNNTSTDNNNQSSAEQGENVRSEAQQEADDWLRQQATGGNSAVDNTRGCKVYPMSRTK